MFSFIRVAMVVVSLHCNRNPNCEKSMKLGLFLATPNFFSVLKLSALLFSVCHSLYLLNLVTHWASGLVSRKLHLNSQSRSSCLSAPLLFSLKYCKGFEKTPPLPTVFLASGLYEGQDHTLLAFLGNFVPGDLRALLDYVAE